MKARHAVVLGLLASGSVPQEVHARRIDDVGRYARRNTDRLYGRVTGVRALGGTRVDGADDQRDDHQGSDDECKKCRAKKMVHQP